MRGADMTQASMFSYRTLEERIPRKHPLRKLRAVVDGLLAAMKEDLDAVYARTGRDAIAPERLLRASLIQTLPSLRSERVLVEPIDYNLLYRWFVGLGMYEKVWHPSTFSANRDRRLNERIVRLFFDKVLLLAEWQGLLSDEHFTVDGTLIEAWAAMKNFKAKDGSSKPPEDETRNPTVDVKGEPRCNDTHASTTDPDARLYRKAEGEKSRLGYLGPALMENRNGRVVEVATTHTSGMAEREAAKARVVRTVTKSGATLGADKGYDVKEFVAAMRRRGVTPHVAQKTKGSAIDKRTPRHAGYTTSLKIRERVEEVFGWGKTVGPLRKARFVGLAKVKAQTVFTMAAYHLTRRVTIFGWRVSTA